MEINCHTVSYESTGYFTQLTIDYINAHPNLTPFYTYPVSDEGIKRAIERRKNFKTDRPTLVAEITKQYDGIALTDKQQETVQSLLQETTFTICTAHQPVIFTGPLYFIYKIFHAIKLADSLNSKFPDNRFVPIFYMGSEDADLDELGHIHIAGEKLQWNTQQTGAVGRMKVDKALLSLIEQMAGQLEIAPFGREIIGLFKTCYTEGTTIQVATLHLVNELFKHYGLLVIIPDNRALKSLFTPIIKRELDEQFSHEITANTVMQLATNYKAQAGGRAINLFYLTENARERIELEGDLFTVKSLGLTWSKAAMMDEATLYPERFSANVILRPLFQETILPNIVFIGGGGETAYWLELKELFAAANVHYPMLLLRNSFLFANAEQVEKGHRLGFETKDLFRNNDQLINETVQKRTDQQLQLVNEKQQIAQVYEKIKVLVEKIDSSLSTHTTALQHRSLEKLEALEKKMLRAEKRKFEAERRQIAKLKSQLFPNNGLQERVENFSVLYATYGSSWMKTVYETSPELQQEFTIVEIAAS